MTGGGSSSKPTQLGAEAGAFGMQDANWLFKQAKPEIAAIMQQVMQLLSGNMMTGMGVPLAQRAVSGARGAASQAMQGAESYLAKSGLEGSPFAAAIQSMIGQQGQEAIGQAPIQVGEQLLSIFGGAPMSAAQTSLGALTSLAGQSQSKTSGGNMGGIGSMLGGAGGFAQGLEGLIGGGGGGAAAGLFSPETWASIAPYIGMIGLGA